MKQLGRRPTDEELCEMVHLDINSVENIYDHELSFPEFVSMIAGSSSKPQLELQKQIRDFREAPDLTTTLNLTLSIPLTLT